MPTNLVVQRLSNDSGNKRPSSRAKRPKSTHYAPPASLFEPAAGSNAAWYTSRAGGTTPSMSADTPVIDLGYRKRTHVIAAIKGERRRNAIRNAFDADSVTPLDVYASPTLPDEDRLALGRLHPSFMGKDRIRYRVVDEYNGDTLSEKPRPSRVGLVPNQR